MSRAQPGGPAALDGLAGGDDVVDQPVGLGLFGREVAVALGVLYRSEAPVYDESVKAQNRMAVERSGKADMLKELRKGHTWTVE